MRQQTIYAINQYIQEQYQRYIITQDVDEAVRILNHVTNLIPLVETVGLAKDY